MSALSPRYSIFAGRHQANVWLLALANALAGGNSALVYATGSIVGVELAPAPGLATLPITLFVIGTASATLPAGAFARRFGRRATFQLGTGLGALCGILAAYAIWHQNFALYGQALFFGGGYAAVIQSYRFAATDGLAPEQRARAISTVLTGGIVAAVLGPQLVTLTMGLAPLHLFVATYIGQALVALLAMSVVSMVDLPRPAAAEAAAARPLLDIITQPAFMLAAFCGLVSYVLMNLVMTSAPLAMKLCGFAPGSSNNVIQWHIMAMYVPSFLTGALISRFGARAIVATGLAMIAAAALADMSGIAITQFTLGLILLGAGWNFGFIGASAMVVETHTPAERNKVQSFNDFLIFGTMALGSFSSGQILAFYGWVMVNKAVLPPVGIALLLLAFVALRQRLGRPSPA
ncbi:MAG: MFS transporter [Hyphomicrobiales bacterium]|nr:MFS transporter [Hyphomicrobiales bacterium]